MVSPTVERELLEELAADLDAETAALRRLLVPLSDPDWARPTPAPGWEIRDQVSHLAYIHEAAVLALEEPERFRAEVEAAAADPGGYTDAIARDHRGVAADALLRWFDESEARLVRSYLAAEPGTRVPWYGPDLSLPSALTARIMETWAHGGDVADALGVTRTPTRALRQVARLGVRTLPNSFAARGLAVPDAPVHVALVAPDGERWAWGHDAPDQVSGPALDFCLVVTQRRHLLDTGLVARGPVATQWLQIAQAFAGPPGPGRPPTG